MATPTIPLTGDQFLWLLGSTLRGLSRDLGSEVTHDQNGDPLDDAELYLVTNEGVFPVKDD